MIKSEIKSGSVAIKGQFTVQKAALKDPSDMLRRAFSVSFSFLFYTSAEGLERT